MKHKIISFTIGLMMGIFIFPILVWGTPEASALQSKAIKVQYYNWQKALDLNFDSNKPKKKFRAKRKIAGLWDCHPYLFYKSSLQKDREKVIKKRRKKL